MRRPLPLAAALLFAGCSGSPEGVWTDGTARLEIYQSSQGELILQRMNLGDPSPMRVTLRGRELWIKLANGTDLSVMTFERGFKRARISSSLPFRLGIQSQVVKEGSEAAPATATPAVPEDEELAGQTRRLLETLRDEIAGRQDFSPMGQPPWHCPLSTGGTPVQGRHHRPYRTSLGFTVPDAWGHDVLCYSDPTEVSFASLGPDTGSPHDDLVATARRHPLPARERDLSNRQ